MVSIDCLVGLLRSKQLLGLASKFLESVWFAAVVAENVKTGT